MGVDMAVQSVTIIDMQNCTNLQEKLVKACEEWGCFRIINHGVPLTLMSEMKEVSLSLLNLPMEIKLRNSHQESSKGYTPPNIASPFFEGLSIYDIASSGAVLGFFDQLDPSPYQREVIVKYCAAVYELANKLGRKLAEGLGMNGVFKECICQMKMNKYNYGPEAVGLTGAVMHSDPGFITILRDDDFVNGLEVVNKITGEWISVDPVPGTFVVNVGDVGRVWSNGRFNNVKHRVQCYKAEVRISLALFVLHPRNEKVETPPQLVDSEHPQLYVPFDFEDYRKLRIKTNAPTGGALEFFRAVKP